MMEEPLDLLDMCKGHAMTYDERRTFRMLKEFPFGWYMDSRWVFGSSEDGEKCH